MYIHKHTHIYCLAYCEEKRVVRQGKRSRSEPYFLYGCPFKQAALVLFFVFSPFSPRTSLSANPENSQSISSNECPLCLFFSMTKIPKPRRKTRHPYALHFCAFPFCHFYSDTFSIYFNINIMLSSISNSLFFFTFTFTFVFLKYFV